MNVEQHHIDDCKRDLPPVRVRVNGQVVWGRTSGRKNRFCTVSVTNEGRLHRGSVLFGDWHFAWATVVRAVMSGAPLKVDFEARIPAGLTDSTALQKVRWPVNWGLGGQAAGGPES